MGEILNLAEDFLYFPNLYSYTFQPFAMIDGRYTIIYPNSTDPNNTISGPFTPKGGIYTIIIEYGRVDRQDPAIIYQTTISGLEFTGINCEIPYEEIGQTCITTATFTNTSRSFIRNRI